jgi:beta-galactosidase
MTHQNTKPWLDTDGNLIQAHGGGVMFHEGIYYWFGENKGGENSQTLDANGYVMDRVDVIGVSCYSSLDLLNWRNEGVVLKAVQDDPEHDLHPSKVCERPKVVYNPSTKRFVMRLHVDSPDYKYARQGIAVSDLPTGPFEYLGSESPFGQDSRDQTMIRVGDDAYTLFSSDWNATLTIAKLSSDFLTATEEKVHTFAKEFREAPAPFFANGKWWMLSSGCTGWDPNVARMDFADELLGEWTAGYDPCIGPGSEITFYCQSTFVFRHEESGRFVAMFDRWHKHDLKNSGYAWLWVDFIDGKPFINWNEVWAG